LKSLREGTGNPAGMGGKNVCNHPAMAFSASQRAQSALMSARKADFTKNARKKYDKNTSKHRKAPDL
jgi:hypothetical protein